MMKKLKMLDPCGVTKGNATNVCKYFTPCGEDARKDTPYFCVSKMGWQMADFLLSGSNIETEKRDMKDFLETGYGKRVVDPKLPTWESKRLSKENIDDVVNKIAERAQELCAKVNSAQVKDGGFKGFGSKDSLNFYAKPEDIAADLL